MLSLSHRKGYIHQILAAGSTADTNEVRTNLNDTRDHCEIM